LPPHCTSSIAIGERPCSTNPCGSLWVIAIGTFAYGMYTLIEAKYRRAR